MKRFEEVYYLINKGKNTAYNPDMMACYGALVGIGEVDLAADLKALRDDEDYYNRQILDNTPTNNWLDCISAMDPYVEWTMLDGTIKRKKSIADRISALLDKLQREHNIDLANLYGDS